MDCGQTCTWKETVNKFIDEKIRCLKQRQVNKRKKHGLKSRVYT